MSDQIDFTFEQWLEELDVEMQKHGCEGSYVEQTGAESWREMFEDGMTPAEAAYEELQAWKLSQ